MTNPRQALALIVVAAVASLAIALASQYWGGLRPCVLCLYQRYPYGVVILIGLLGLAVADKPGWPRILLVLAGLVFLLDAGIAFFHVGVEQKWWQGTAACGSNFDLNLSAEELKDLLMNQPMARCDEVPWSLFGISMAGYNFIYAVLWGFYALMAAARVDGAGMKPV
ncbi:MAG: disulfide bond formation protein B [Dongiaceae bacterium]